MNNNISEFDPSRKKVGSIYLEAQEKGEKHVTVGDMTNELLSSLVEDINETVASNPFEGRPFFITVHEKKDLQMKHAIHRRIITTLYRPYPEDDTLVFLVDPKACDLKFCWCLPHSSEMDNMLSSHNLYNKEMIADIRAWKALDLYHFGFTKDEIGNWMMNDRFKDRQMRKPVIAMI